MFQYFQPSLNLIGITKRYYRERFPNGCIWSRLKTNRKFTYVILLNSGTLKAFGDGDNSPNGKVFLRNHIKQKFHDYIAWYKYSSEMHTFRVVERAKKVAMFLGKL